MKASTDYSKWTRDELQQTTMGTIKTKPAIRTSLVEVTDRLPGSPPCRILVKNEFEQPSGSFKLRGVSHLINEATEKAKAENKIGVHVFSSSGGNAGLAAAYASKELQIPCTVVLPVTSKQNVIDKLKSWDAEVLIHGAHWGEANEYLKATVIANLDDSIYPVYCHPFEHPKLWEGHGELIDEIAGQLTREQLAKVKGIVCSVGGGGLYCGVVTGLERNPGLETVPVIAVETVQTSCFTQALAANKQVYLTKLDTIVNCLASPYITQHALDTYRSHKTHVEAIDDLEAVRASVQYFDTFRTLVEPACGATLSFAFDNVELLADRLGPLSSDDIVILVACGGAAISPELLNEYRTIV